MQSMDDLSKHTCGCTLGGAEAKGQSPGLEMLPIYRPPEKDEPCCGPPAGPPSSPDERPGYSISPYVEEFMRTAAGPVPRVRTEMDRRDRLGTLAVRLGFNRNSYKVAPGLYAVGRPDDRAPVLVTANYKLSFDHMRRTLSGVDAWLLVLDTRGINVWCAAGKGTFGTDELVRRVKLTQLERVVRHRRLIVPQLGATGVAARGVKKGCGFEVVWGPISAVDIKQFLSSGEKCTEPMRRVTFSLAERLVLVPVEITLLKKYLLHTLIAITILSGIGPHVFSLSAAWHRGLLAVAAAVSGILAGCVIVPVLLPWLPGRSFALKGWLSGAITGLVLVLWQWTDPWVTTWSALALLLICTPLSSFLAMNFTGSTPFTSPSGVEKEMRRHMPVQATAALAGVALWVVSAFR